MTNEYASLLCKKGDLSCLDEDWVRRKQEDRACREPVAEERIVASALGQHREGSYMEELMYVFFFVLYFCILRIPKHLEDHWYEKIRLQDSGTVQNHLRLMD